MSQEKENIQVKHYFRSERTLAVAVFVIGWFPILLVLLTAPGQITPVLNNPIFQKALIVATLWQLLCCFFLSRPQNKYVQFALVAIGSFPIMVGWMLWPAIVTILESYNLLPK